MRNLLYSLISFAIALFFFVLGIAGVLLPWSPKIRTDLIVFILEDSIAIFLFGFGLIIVGAAIAVNIALSLKRSYFRVRSGPRSIWIDETILQDYMDNYWAKLFPQSQIPNSLSLKNNKIYLAADLPYIPQQQQKDILERIQSDLGEMLAALFGYHQTFYLSASFQKEPKQSQNKSL